VPAWSRKSAAAAISSGRTSRCTGNVTRNSAARHGEVASSMGVSAAPGATVLTATPVPSSSVASARVNPTIAPLLAA